MFPPFDDPEVERYWTGYVAASNEDNVSELDEMCRREEYQHVCAKILSQIGAKTRAFWQFYSRVRVGAARRFSRRPLLDDIPF